MSWRIEPGKLGGDGFADAIFVGANDAKELLHDGAFVAGIPGDGEADVSGCGEDLEKDETGTAEVLDAGGYEGDAFTSFDEGEDAGPSGGAVDDIG